MSENKQVPVFSFKNSIRLVPLYDLHVGAPTFDEKALIQTIDYIKKNDNVYWSLDGDCLENVTANCVADPYSQVMLPHDQAEYLISLLKPIKHRATYSIMGNHVNRTRRRAYYDLMVSISRELNLKYIGIGGYVNFQVGKQRYVIATQHGSSGAVNWQLEIKKLRNIYPEAEIFILGHDHNLAFEPKLYDSIDKKNVTIDKHVLFCRAGNYLGYADYARQNLYEKKVVGSLNIKFHKEFHYITGYRMMYINSIPYYDMLNNAGNHKQKIMSL